MIRFVKKGHILMCSFESVWDDVELAGIRHCQYLANVTPEIGKVRPILVVRSHKRCSSAIVVPFTTQPPKHEVKQTLHIPKNTLPGVLAKKECWALCDFTTNVSLKRLNQVYSGKKNLHVPLNKSFLLEEYFNQIRGILNSMF
jgi:uncharacterized protein YifN (PemK superfamily)